MVQLNSAGRVVYAVAVSQGNVYSCPSGDTSWTVATNGTSPLVSPPLNYSGVVASSPLNQRLYFADGVNYCYWDPSTNTVYTWAASAGTLPVDSAGNTPRLICTWRGSIVLSGLLYDSSNYFISATFDPTNFDYAPAEGPTPTMAVAGNNAPAGQVGDVITCLIPYSDDVLLFGGDHSVYMLRGHPAAGGEVDLVTDTIGMAWGRPWARDPFGNVFFVSNTMRVYSLTPGQQPQCLSDPIEQLLDDTNSGTTTVRALWDDRRRGCHFFFTPTAGPAAATHFFWEARTGGWFPDVFAENNHNPLVCCTFDGNTADDRVGLIGSWDGYVRCFDDDATSDDSTTMTSYVMIGPINSKDLDTILLKDLQAVLGENSGDVTWSVHLGDTAEEALAASASASGTWSAGRSQNTLVRLAAHSLWLKLTATGGWSFENCRARLVSLGKVQRRKAS